MYFFGILSDIIVFGGVKLLNDIANNEDTPCRREFFDTLDVTDKYLVESLRLSLSESGDVKTEVVHFKEMIQAKLRA